MGVHGWRSRRVRSPPGRHRRRVATTFTAATAKGRAGVGAPRRSGNVRGPDLCRRSPRAISLPVQAAHLGEASMCGSPSRLVARITKRRLSPSSFHSPLYRVVDQPVVPEQRDHLAEG
jgi:hypothetical protein